MVGESQSVDQLHREYEENLAKLAAAHKIVEEQKRRIENAERRKVEEEKRKKQAEEEQRKKAEEEQRRKNEEEGQRKKAEEERRRKAAETRIGDFQDGDRLTVGRFIIGGPSKDPIQRYIEQRDENIGRGVRASEEPFVPVGTEEEQQVCITLTLDTAL
jgi:hypothetical protein